MFLLSKSSSNVRKKGKRIVVGFMVAVAAIGNYFKVELARCSLRDRAQLVSRVPTDDFRKTILLFVYPA